MGQLSFRLLEIERESTRKRVEEALDTARTYKHIKKMHKTIEPVFESVQRLSRLEREIIEKRYLDDEDIFDFEVYATLNLSERKYYRVKSRAFYKLAFMLELEVVVDHEETIAEG